MRSGRREEWDEKEWEKGRGEYSLQRINKECSFNSVDVSSWNLALGWEA